MSVHPRVLTRLFTLALLFTRTDQLHAADAMEQPAAGTAQTGARVQQIPLLTPAPPYLDRDSAARQPTLQELGLQGHMDLASLRERADHRSRDWQLQALVGQMEHLSRDRGAGEDRYQRAVSAAGSNRERLRHVLWSRGWARLYSGDMQGALEDWRDAAKLHGGKPEWYPYTVALAYWHAGSRPLGMRWFEASQLASQPDGNQRLPYLDVSLIAQSLIGDMFAVRELRARPDTPRMGADAPKLEWPAYIARPPPQYPRLAVMSKKQGKVVALACVDARGKVQTTQIAKTSGHAMLDKAATDAIAGWQFRPETCGGKPRDSWVAVPVDYALMSYAQGSRIPPRLPRKPAPDSSLFDFDCNREVGLDPTGFTLVAQSCDSGIVCSVDAVWTPENCGVAPTRAAAIPSR